MVTPTVQSFVVSSEPIVYSPASDLRGALANVNRGDWSTVPRPQSTEPYGREILVDTPELLVVAARWRAGARCDLHGHSSSAGLYRVVEGAVEQQSYIPARGRFDYDVEQLSEGDESYLPAGSYHQILAHTDAITLHAYSPRPDDAVSDVQAGDLPKLDAARRSRHAARARSGNSTPIRAAAPSDTVEELAEVLAARWKAYEDQAYVDGNYRLPFRVLEDIRSSGILAAPLPRRHGGLGASLAETAHAVSRIASEAPAAALAIVMPLGNAATCQIPFTAVAPEHVSALRANQRWIADQVLRGRILAVANSEPGAGANLSQTQTTASVGADGVTRLTGRKAFATIGPDADYFLCAARVAGSEDAAGKARIDGFFVHRDAAGIAVDDCWSPFGMRPTASVGLRLDGAQAECVLGFAGCLEGVNARHWSTLLFSAVFLGIGQAALREGIKFGGKSAWARAKLAGHALALDAASGYLDAVCEAEIWPMPKNLLDRVQRVKTYVTQVVVDAAMQAAMISGGRCYSPNHTVYRLLSDALAGPLLRPPLASAMDGIADRLESIAG